MCWLHRVLHHRDQMLAQLVQVYLIAQRGTERLYDLGRIIFSAIKTAVNDLLNTLPQRLEQCRNSQRRDHNNHVIILTHDSSQQVLQNEDEAKVDQSQQDRQRTIDQRTIDEHIDVPQPSAQYGEPKREWNDEGPHGSERIESHRIE